MFNFKRKDSDGWKFNSTNSFYTKEEVDSKVNEKILEMFEELKTDNKTIIGAINELHVRKIGTDDSIVLQSSLEV